MWCWTCWDQLKPLRSNSKVCPGTWGVLHKCAPSLLQLTSKIMPTKPDRGSFVVCCPQFLLSATSTATNCSLISSHLKSTRCLDPFPNLLTSYSSLGFALTCPHARQWCRLLVSALKGSLHFMHMVTSLSRIHLGALFPSSAFWQG